MMQLASRMKAHWEHLPHDALTAVIPDPAEVRPLEKVEVRCDAPDDETSHRATSVAASPCVRRRPATSLAGGSRFVVSNPGAKMVAMSEV